MLRNLRQLGSVLLLATLLSACGGSTPGQGPQANGEDGSEALVDAESSPTIAPTETPVPPMFPVPINRGLASLDSYRMSYTNDVYDSVPDQRSVITFVVAQDKEADATYNSTESQITTEDYQVASTHIEEQIVIGNQVCILSDGVATVNIMSDSARELSGIMSQGFTYNPIIENPEFVSEGVVNGVPVRLYEFEVTSVSATSDAEVGRAEGNYALADDGDYLVEYRLDMELRTGPEGAPEAEYSVSFFDLSLEGINEPQEIVFPETCETAFQFAP
ncbi:MAG: hypothetical protein PVH60_06475 [Anaerolineales bacterium]|jgi:hypothetical protein